MEMVHSRKYEIRVRVCTPMMVRYCIVHTFPFSALLNAQFYLLPIAFNGTALNVLCLIESLNVTLALSIQASQAK